MDKNLTDLKEMLLEEIKKITKKGDISATELNNVNTAVCIIEKIQKIENGDMEYSEQSYGRRMPMYNYGYDGGESYGRGRSPVTGRYISTGVPADARYPSEMYRGYSGHSIKDRMIAKLEDMYDTASTDHEKEVVNTWIRRLSEDK